MMLILAAESLHKTLWYPTILGVLVVVAAVVLFLGSIYVLLGTNLAARLGFLIAFTGLAGFMMLPSLLWCTTASPLTTLKGPTHSGRCRRSSRHRRSRRPPSCTTSSRSSSSPRPPKLPT